ncbi:shikimate dehydrogenase family protein [Burkholderia cepacia]|uniref:shikimate dehydrogenase family protein n=1 Tax=Burkholderia cepacia TaxID=292 RepID=UPI000758AF32|nr:shikimate dehydrogenase [Burkholderia cepacia]KVW83217.1 shikimate dehydrogenase [Burkholderia cepacia]KVX72422.1 shikimate dehydrogenase [Burkholderia cepacia]
MKINGATRVFYCIADPIEQVRAPELFNHLFEAYDVNAVMVPLQVTPGQLAPTLSALLASPTVGGISLSIPHKTTAAGLVSKWTSQAQIAHAVNAIRRGPAGVEGALFDGLGFVRSLARMAFDATGRNVLLIGAGGAASALATALAERRAARIGLFDPDAPKAVQLAETVAHAFPECRVDAVPSNDPAGYDLVVNASPLGLRVGDPLPVPVERLDPHAFVYDILMKGQPTPLVTAARALGLRASPGFDMLVQQASLYLDFFGFPALAMAADTHEADLRALLEADCSSSSGARAPVFV